MVAVSLSIRVEFPPTCEIRGEPRGAVWPLILELNIPGFVRRSKMERGIGAARCRATRDPDFNGDERTSECLCNGSTGAREKLKRSESSAPAGAKRRFYIPCS